MAAPDAQTSSEPELRDECTSATGDALENEDTSESGWVWDEVSGYYYEPRWGLYFDGTSGNQC